MWLEIRENLNLHKKTINLSTTWRKQLSRYIFSLIAKMKAYMFKERYKMRQFSYFIPMCSSLLSYNFQNLIFLYVLNLVARNPYNHVFGFVATTRGSIFTWYSIFRWRLCQKGNKISCLVVS